MPGLFVPVKKGETGNRVPIIPLQLLHNENGSGIIDRIPDVVFHANFIECACSWLVVSSRRIQHHLAHALDLAVCRLE